LAFARIFGGGVMSQALLSIINLLTGLILIRRASQAQYGSFVLISGAAPLVVQLQNQLIAPLLTKRVTAAPDSERKSYVGGLLREQRYLQAMVAAAGLLICAAVWLAGGELRTTALIFLAGAIAAVAALFRDFLRMMLVTYRRPYDVLRADVVYAALFVAGVWFATLTDIPAALSALAMAAAATVGGLLLSRALWRHDPWTSPGMRGAFSQSVMYGLWAATGAVIHWVFNQGYTYIVAVRLDVTAVAAIAATRLLLSPLGVFSLGISSLMFPTATLWLQHHGLRGLLRRVLLFALGLAAISLVYLVIMWSVRDWIFLYVLKRDYAQRDLLLGLWSAIFFATVIRDQLIFLQMARGHFKRLAGLTAFCAALGLSVTFFATQNHGAAGGLLGLLAGELAYVGGVIFLTVRDVRASAPPAPNDLPVTS